MYQMNEETDKQTDKVKPLNLRQQKFVEYYLSTGNATQAADYAGYAHPNHQAFRLLLNNSVKTHIASYRDVMSKNSDERRADWVLQLEQIGASADKDSDRLRAIEQLFKAEGWIAPEKQEIVQYDATFLADLDMDEGEFIELSDDNPSDNSDLH